MAKQLRSGYTTGACAAAGVKAALLYEAGAAWQEIDLTALDGTLLHIPVKAVVRTDLGIQAEVVKFSVMIRISPTAYLSLPRYSISRECRHP